MANILLKNQNNVASKDKMIFPLNYQNKVGVKKTTPSEDNLTMKIFNVHPASVSGKLSSSF